MSEINDKGTNAVEGADQDASGHIRAFQTPAEPDTIRALMGEADEDTSGHIRAFQTPAEPDTIRALMGEADEDTSGHIRAY